MAVPKRKHSTGRKGRRRVAIKFSLPTLVACPNCGHKKPPHVACLNCGQYKGVAVTKEKEPEKKKKRGSKS